MTVNSISEESGSWLNYTNILTFIFQPTNCATWQTMTVAYSFMSCFYLNIKCNFIRIRHVYSHLEATSWITNINVIIECKIIHQLPKKKKMSIHNYCMSIACVTDQKSRPLVLNRRALACCSTIL